VVVKQRKKVVVVGEVVRTVEVQKERTGCVLVACPISHQDGLAVVVKQRKMVAGAVVAATVELVKIGCAPVECQTLLPALAVGAARQRKELAAEAVVVVLKKETGIARVVASATSLLGLLASNVKLGRMEQLEMTAETGTARDVDFLILHQEEPASSVRQIKMGLQVMLEMSGHVQTQTVVFQISQHGAVVISARQLTLMVVVVMEVTVTVPLLDLVTGVALGASFLTSLHASNASSVILQKMEATTKSPLMINRIIYWKLTIIFLVIK